MRMTLRSLSLFGVVTGIAMLGVSPARATLAGTLPVLPGQTITISPPPVGDATGDPTGALLADEVENFSLSTSTGVFKGTLESAVYQESGGTLDFYYQLNNMSTATSGTPDTAEHANGSNFVGFTTSAGYRMDGGFVGTTFTASSLTPDTANRNASGSVVEFNYNVFGLVDDIPTGSSSSVLVISTNATAFVAGNASAIDSGTSTVASFQPATAVPEPGSITLLGSLLFGIAAIARRRLSR
jgi:hypothetical protein